MAGEEGQSWQMAVSGPSRRRGTAAAHPQHGLRTAACLRSPGFVQNPLTATLLETSQLCQQALDKALTSLINIV